MMEKTEFVTKDNVHEATNLEKIRSLMANAERLGEDELVKKCKKRIFEIAGNEYETEIEKRLFQALAAYEEILREKHDKAIRANYTKRKIKNKGVIHKSDIEQFKDHYTNDMNSKKYEVALFISYNCEYILGKGIFKIEEYNGYIIGYFGLPSDILEGVNFVNDYLAEKGSSKHCYLKML